MFCPWPFRQQNGHPDRAGTPEVKHSPDPTATSLPMATSILKNDQPAPGGATKPTAIVKNESESRQSKDTPDERQEMSGNPSKIYCTYSQSSHFRIYLMINTNTFNNI